MLKPCVPKLGQVFSLSLAFTVRCACESVSQMCWFWGVGLEGGGGLFLAVLEARARRGCLAAVADRAR